MLEFRKIKLEDKEWIKPLLNLSGYRGCEYTFGNNFLWSDAYNIKVARYKDFYLVQSGDNYFYPSGKGDIPEIISVLRQHCRELGKPLCFASSPKSGMELLKEIYSDSIQVTENRDFFDYCYNYTDLATLVGKKYHSKRNFINRFESNRWSYEEINPDNVYDCKLVVQQWYEENTENDNASMKQETAVACKGLDNFTQLDFVGGLLKVEGKPVAFTYGERINSDTFDVHVEKALSLYDGSYPMINKQFVSHLSSEYKYINREEDMGEENLRKAKLSYHPAFMEEKFRITFKD